MSVSEAVKIWANFCIDPQRKRCLIFWISYYCVFIWNSKANFFSIDPREGLFNNPNLWCIISHRGSLLGGVFCVLMWLSCFFHNLKSDYPPRYERWLPMQTVIDSKEATRCILTSIQKSSPVLFLPQLLKISL